MNSEKSNEQIIKEFRKLFGTAGNYGSCYENGLPQQTGFVEQQPQKEPAIEQEIGFSGINLEDRRGRIKWTDLSPTRSQNDNRDFEGNLLPADKILF